MTDYFLRKIPEQGYALSAGARKAVDGIEIPDPDSSRLPLGSGS